MHDVSTLISGVLFIEVREIATFSRNNFYPADFSIISFLVEAQVGMLYVWPLGAVVFTSAHLICRGKNVWSEKFFIEKRKNNNNQNFIINIIYFYYYNNRAQQGLPSLFGNFSKSLKISLIHFHFGFMYMSVTVTRVPCFFPHPKSAHRA